MDKIEIGLRKGIVIPIIVILLVIMTGMNYVIFFTNLYTESQTTRALYILINCMLLYVILSQLKKIFKKTKMIIFTNEAIAIRVKDIYRTFFWSEIIDISIQNNDAGYFLNLRTADDDINTTVTWLDKTPEELKRLIEDYKNAASRVNSNREE